MKNCIFYYDILKYSFLNLIIDKYSTNKTAIIFLSDHGGRLPGPYYVLFVEEFIYEQELAGLFLLLPENNIYFLNLTSPGKDSVQY